MEQDNFYFILVSRFNGRLSAQREYLERSYKKMRKKDPSPRDAMEKIIKAYTNEFVELRKQVQNKIQQLKGQATTTKKESITRWHIWMCYHYYRFNWAQCKIALKKKLRIL